MPGRPGDPLQVEHEDARPGAVQLFAALATRTGTVYGLTCRRKRQVESLALPAHLDQPIPAVSTTIHLITDNVSIHHGKQVRRWLAAPPRVVPHCTPVHRSWMNPVAQGFGILHPGTPGLRHPNCADLPAPARRGDPPVQPRVEHGRPSVPLDRGIVRHDPCQGRSGAAIPRRLSGGGVMGAAVMRSGP